MEHACRALARSLSVHGLCILGSNSVLRRTPERARERVAVGSKEMVSLINGCKAERRD